AISRSTAFRSNVHELKGAISEGVYFAENLNLHEVVVDRYNSASGITVTTINDEKKYMAARSIIIATGTHENSITLEECREYKRNADTDSPATVQIDENNFHISEEGTVSIFGDIHPHYKGSVVRALASAKTGYSSISKELEKHPKCPDNGKFFSEINNVLLSRVVSVVELADKIVEITIHSPLASANFQPGMFYRLQNIGENDRHGMEMECIAVTGAYVDKKCGTVTVVVLDVGGSSRLCWKLKSGQLVSLMGPTGTPTHIPNEKNVLLIGGGVGNAVLFSIGKEMLDRKCNVLFFAGFRFLNSVFGIQHIEAASDVAVLCCEDGYLVPNRQSDFFYKSNIVHALLAYGADTKAAIALNTIDRVVMVGSCGMMAAINRAISCELKHLFRPDIEIIASINSPMQCMMKEICGQCIQKHVDPLTGAESFVYSCVNQDQCAKKVDFDFLQNRLKQNNVLEKCASMWVNHCLSEHVRSTCVET
ncbi:glutamate synthase subunit beta, partial [Candidatus Anaplasma sp. TIGMIC]|nr:glutamate synthase subunit beta [Candidatus Anaplasma sp. TIGMIC]